ncbi:MAG: hypothetical protein JO165_05620 [Candidatus Eremiobacteraeota bacterium]|nr:hypothetical protein [Candidatus Eremiobacteraeota bacterium]
MGIPNLIRLVLSNIVAVFLVVAIIVTIVKVRRGSGESPASILWREVLFYCIGLGMVWAFIFHAFAQRMSAASIGWTPSPFEWELAWAEAAMALVALMAFWGNYGARLAATLMFFVFCLGATIQHINQIVCCHNYAPGNAGPILWFNDIALPLFLLVLALLAARRPNTPAATAA